MGDMDEDRIYDEKAGRTLVYVATGDGLAVVELADRVGRFRMARRGPTNDVASSGRDVVIATDEDVFVGKGEEFEAMDFGPAVAVGVDQGGHFLAASPDGTVARYDDGGWPAVGTVEYVRAIDDALVATTNGVFKVDGPALTHVGLDDVRDVTGGETPYAATEDGIYRLGPGWVQDFEGDARLVSSGTLASGDVRTHAATEEGLYERVDGEWEALDPPAESAIVDVVYGQSPYAVTRDGTMLVQDDVEWRRRTLGLGEVRAMTAITDDN